MKIRIEPYKTWSGGARRLGQRAGILRATPQQVREHGDFDLVINWGRTERRFNGDYLNEPEKVRNASDKLACCKIFKEHKVPTPEFTESKGHAQRWLNDGTTVVARKMLRASGGRGIVLCTPEGDTQLPAAPLYTKYIKKSDEYRIHVFDGRVIDSQQKRRNTDVPDDQVDWQIRNHDRGFIFARSDVSPPICVTDAAILAVSACGLDLGAVDIGYNRKRDKCRVYEVNTAPGLEGSTLDSYYTALVERYSGLRSGAYARRRDAWNRRTLR